MSRPIDADLLGLTDMEIIMCDGNYKEALKMLIDKIEHAPTIEQEPQWIPCSERLPDPEAKTYWICTDTGYQCECRWTNVNIFWTNLTTDWHWHIMDIPQYTKVTAWMPLPEPYMRGKQDE